MILVFQHHARTLPAALAAAGLAVAVLASSDAVQAQSVNSRIDQPTPGTLPSGTNRSEDSTAPANQPTGRAAPPSAISSSTGVMQSGGSVQGKGGDGTVDPIEHLPKTMRR